MTQHTLPEPHIERTGNRLNRLRAGVLGANDGIVSVAATVVGVAGATTATGPVLVAGTAAVIGGALSMAMGEYVSVSSQRDSEEALIEKEKRELREMPQAELDELAELYRERGLSEATARQVALELTEKDVLRAHLDAELGIDPDDIASPWAAAVSSALAFFVGSLLPLLAILLPPPHWRIPVTFAAVLLALALTGTLGARLGGTPRVGRATVRVVLGGAIALGATFLIGSLLGVSAA
ncbi:VIT family protein [Kocuria sp.]|uniref:VIT1/CCC1 transporter family protein n=1 Tax=Kocuria sp. TaxID=1871328 RepID=UPI0026DD47D3|nr:VIT family protein [Kocuria sp.]MDO4918381.1 VIT family protein [Kocuria sp.]